MSTLSRFWAWIRYQHLLPFSSRNRSRGRAYASVVGAVEYWLDRPRRVRGVARVASGLSTTSHEARRVIRDGLAAEAQAEADVTFLIRHPGELLAHLPDASAPLAQHGRTVFAAMNTGAEVFAYAYLRKVCRLNVRALSRPFGPDNPMSPAKERYAEQRRKWLWIQLGVDELDGSPASAAVAERHLAGGAPLFAPLDALATASVDTHPIELCEERLLTSAEVFALARRTGSSIVPVAAIRAPDGVRIHFGAPISSGREDAWPALAGALEEFIRRWPDQWCQWPHVRPAGGRPARVPRRVPVPGRPVPEPARLTT